jgi:hippurate hydrolase
MGRMGISSDEILSQAGELLPDAVALRRRIHSNPELGLELPETQREVLEQLDGLGLEVEIGKTLTSVVATLRGARPGPTILLRGDMDALPMPEDNDLEFRSKNAGRMHACGHDSHVAMLVGAARALAARRDELSGSVRFMFQPGEEGFAGARYMIEEGVLEGVDAAFAIHIDPRIPVGMVATRPGSVLASADVVGVTLRGRGGHASMPHDTVDPIPAACELVQALQTMITRRINAFDPAVLTVSKIQAGTTGNVIPESAELLGTLRTVSERTRKQAKEGIQRVANGVAAAHELVAEINVVDGYPVTVNDAEFTAFTQRALGELLGDSAVFEMPSPVMGAEDFSFVLQNVPGAMVFLGVRPDGVDHPAPCHSNRMLINESAMTQGIAAHTAIALQYLG